MAPSHRTSTRLVHLSASSPARRPLRPTTPRLQPPPSSPPATPDDSHVGRPEARSSLFVSLCALSSESQPAPIRAGRHPSNTNSRSALSLEACSAIPAASATGSAVRKGSQVHAERQAESVPSTGASPSAARRGRQEAEVAQVSASQPFRQEQQVIGCADTGEVYQGSSICQASLQSEG